MRDEDEFRYAPWGAKLGRQIYWNAINALRNVWYEIYGEHIEISVQGKAGFKRLLDEIKNKLVEKRGLEKVVGRLRDRGYDLVCPAHPRSEPWNEALQKKKHQCRSRRSAGEQRAPKETRHCLQQCGIAGSCLFM